MFNKIARGVKFPWIKLASFLVFYSCNAEPEEFKLITVLYNETKKERISEYLTCLEKNLAHNRIDKIHIVYDTSKDHGASVILDYVKSKELPITYINGRATYAFCFDLVNELYPNSRVILSNADIYFNETLELLDNYDLTNKFLVLTRWNIQKDTTMSLLRGNNGEEVSNSHDSWIFSTPIHFQNGNILIGTLGCDRTIAFQAKKSGLTVINPCLSIQGCHLHLSGIRNWDKTFAYPKEGSILVPYSKISEKPKELIYLKFCS